jgi:hypothetical protein
VKHTIILLMLLASSPAIGAIPPGLTLSGDGIVRYMGIFKVYEAELFAPPDASPETIVNAETPRCLRLTYAASVKVDDITKAADIIMARQQDEATIARIRSELDTLNTSYRDVKKGDVYLMCYDDTTRSTTLTLNDESLVVIESAEFASVYFGIWLNENEPISTSLREDLLSGLADNR